jgi:hypothetical protein
VETVYRATLPCLTRSLQTHNCHPTRLPSFLESVLPSFRRSVISRANGREHLRTRSVGQDGLFVCTYEPRSKLPMSWRGLELSNLLDLDVQAGANTVLLSTKGNRYLARFLSTQSTGLPKTSPKSAGRHGVTHNGPTNDPKKNTLRLLQTQIIYTFGNMN